MSGITDNIWRIERYTPADADVWNEFVKNSRNATFLFYRQYMDYHSDRFTDCSWLAYKNNRLAAILPANVTVDGVLHSHQGLTYGGWLLPKNHINGADLLDIFNASVEIWRKSGLRALDYKTLPQFYSRQPSEEDRYALFMLGATLCECNMSATINLREEPKFNKMQRRHLAKASRLPFSVEQTFDLPAFMEMVRVCLKERHNEEPVHTAEEMELLRSRFPDNIKFFVTMFDGHPQAGVCVYECGTVAHAQYIATTRLGRELNLLSPLFNYLIKDRYSDFDYFDFGICNEEEGHFLNRGLLLQKCSYGASGAVYTRYELDF